MNRVIKFRALSHERKWVYGLPIKLIYDHDEITGIQDGENNEDIIEGTVGQFTGLTDNNGKEIYEGDWCTAKFRTKDGIQVIQGNIIMDEFMWCIDCTGCVGDDIFSINRPHDFEIIGNIHENPELLTPSLTKE